MNLMWVVKLFPSANLNSNSPRLPVPLKLQKANLTPCLCSHNNIEGEEPRLGHDSTSTGINSKDKEHFMSFADTVGFNGALKKLRFLSNLDSLKARL